MERSAAASLKVWLGRFRSVRGFLLKIDLVEELLDVEEEGGEEVGEVIVDVDEDLTESKLNP